MKRFLPRSGTFPEYVYLGVACERPPRREDGPHDKIQKDGLHEDSLIGMGRPSALPIWGSKGPEKRPIRRKMVSLTLDIVRKHADNTRLTPFENVLALWSWVTDQTDKFKRSPPRTIRLSSSWNVAQDELSLALEERPSSPEGVRPYRAKLLRPLVGALFIPEPTTVEERCRARTLGLRPPGVASGCKWPWRACVPWASSQARWHGDPSVLLHSPTGRGDELLSDGDIETNPGPLRSCILHFSLPNENIDALTSHLKFRKCYPCSMGRGALLPSCGDVEVNPGPKSGTPAERGPDGGPTPWDSDLAILARNIQNYLVEHQACDQWQLLCLTHSKDGPACTESSIPGHTRLCCMACVQCTICGALLRVRAPWQLGQHCPVECALGPYNEDAVPIEEKEWLETKEVDHGPAGRGEDLLSCGDAESNPGPFLSKETHSHKLPRYELPYYIKALAIITTFNSSKTTQLKEFYTTESYRTTSAFPATLFKIPNGKAAPSSPGAPPRPPKNFILQPPCQLGYSSRTVIFRGRGSVQTCGDVEENPGPPKGPASSLFFIIIDCHLELSWKSTRFLWQNARYQFAKYGGSGPHTRPTPIPPLNRGSRG